ncbi:penicillin acylase family protein [Methylomonas sp. HYX-M1]|uniref:penicillin acylase family protein n=1 Tax=Methylomonas sp. HYX-M1 TaxID=3139307 RepID=UPI00345C2EA0
MTKTYKAWQTVLVAVACATVLAAAAAYLWLRQSLPAADGEQALSGLAEPVRIETDNLGVPRIIAAGRSDAVRALGYLHAGDRLFQMDLMRRKNAGRLAELFGAIAVGSDVKARTYGFNMRAKQVLLKLPAAQRSYLEAYAAGVNDYLQRARALPFEFDVLAYRPEPWQAEDSLLVIFGMFDNLTAWAEQYERMLTVMDQALPAEVVTFLTPDSDRYTDALQQHAPARVPSGPLPIAALHALLSESLPAGRALAHAPEETMPGSNAWAVSGAKTADGRAIVANDMHLGINVPNIWYRVQLEYPGVLAAGVSLPGTPCLVAGSNQHVGWGLTNLAGDFLDLVLLEGDTQRAGQYRVGSEWRNFEQRRELIRIKGEADKELLVEESLWGPVAQQPLLGQKAAIHWTALDVDAVNLDILELEQAGGLQQAIAVANRAGGPQLNVLLADSTGHIAWTLTGKLPLRRSGDGSIARSWADGDAAWSGYLAAADMPKSVDPAAGFLLSANDRRFGTELPYSVGRNFASGYRAYRIDQRLRQMSRFDEWSLFNLQQDTYSEFYTYYQQLALSVLTPDKTAGNAELNGLRNYLLSWNGRADTDSLGLPLLIEFRKQLIASVFSPFLQRCRQLEPDFEYSWNYVDTPLQALLDSRPPQLVPEPAQHDWQTFILSQLTAAAANLQAAHPAVALAALNWGEVNRAEFSHPFAKALPALSTLLDMPRQALAGCGGYCVRVTGARFGASERLVVSPGRFAEGILHMPGGQSGHPLSAHYRDQQPYWLTGLPLPFAAGNSVHTMTLRPPGTQ